MFSVFKKLQQALLVLVACGLFFTFQPPAQAQTYDETPYVTRAEFLEYVMRINLDVWFWYDCDEELFTDAKGHERDVVCSAYQHGYITASKTFRPADPVTVAEAAKLFMKVMYPNQIMICKDCRWYEPYINFLSKQQELPTSVDAVTDYLTKEDVAYMLHMRLIDDVNAGPRWKEFYWLFDSYAKEFLDEGFMLLGSDKVTLSYMFPIEYPFYKEYLQLIKDKNLPELQPKAGTPTIELEPSKPCTEDTWPTSGLVYAKTIKTNVGDLNAQFFAKDKEVWKIVLETKNYKIEKDTFNCTHDTWVEISPRKDGVLWFQSTPRRDYFYYLQNGRTLDFTESLSQISTISYLGTIRDYGDMVGIHTYPRWGSSRSLEFFFNDNGELIGQRTLKLGY